MALPNPDELRVTIADMRKLLTLSIDLLAICAKITGKVDPELNNDTHVRDELTRLGQASSTRERGRCGFQLSVCGE